MEPNSAPSWKRTPNFLRTSYRRFSRSPTIWSPSTQISPRSGRRSPRMFFSRTDFPVPDGPRMAVILPFGTSKVMSSSTVWEPNDFVTPRREMIGSPGAIHGCPTSCCWVSIREEPIPYAGLALGVGEVGVLQAAEQAADVVDHAAEPRSG